MRIFLKCEDARSMTLLAVDYGSGFFPNRIQYQRLFCLYREWR